MPHVTLKTLEDPDTLRARLRSLSLHRDDLLVVDLPGHVKWAPAQLNAFAESLKATLEAGGHDEVGVLILTEDVRVRRNGALDADLSPHDAMTLEMRLNDRHGLDHGVEVAEAWRMGATVLRNRLLGRRTCRVCGCWELEACEEGCSWVAEELCSQCAPPVAAGDA